MGKSLNAGVKKLEAKLLSIGGERVAALPEPHLRLLLQRGRVFEAEGRKKVWGEPHRCHWNASYHYIRRHYTWNVVTGYGLSDGVWFQHSWLYDGNRVVETTIRHELYFGVVLTAPEAARFVIEHLLTTLPGVDELVKARP